MFDTLAVFQPAMFWLNADAELNICEPRRSITKRQTSAIQAEACQPSAGMQQPHAHKARGS